MLMPGKEASAWVIRKRMTAIDSGVFGNNPLSWCLRVKRGTIKRARKTSLGNSNWSRLSVKNKRGVKKKRNDTERSANLYVEVGANKEDPFLR